MELNWSTFFLEIINFLVLVWILKRFLYKPVREIIEQRRQRINDTLNESQALRDEANDLQQQYQTRLSGWEQEKIQAREKLQQEINAERAHLLKNLQTSLEQEREKARSLDKRHKAEVRIATQQEAFDISVQFATRFLSRFKGPDLEKKLIEMFLEDLPVLPETQLKKVRSEFEATQST